MAGIAGVQGVGAIELDFTKAEDDFVEAFVYWVDCGGLLEEGDPNDPDDNGAFVWPSDHSNTAGEEDIEYKAPLVLDVNPGTTASCSVTPRRGTVTASLWTPSTVLESVVSLDSQPATLTLEAKALGIDLLISDAAEYPAGTTVTHAAECRNASDEVVWQSENVTEGQVVSIPVTAGALVTCTAVTTVQYKTATALDKDVVPAQETAAAVAAPTVTVTPDLGGVLISWSTDPDLASAVSQAFSLTCTQGEQTLLDAEVMAADATTISSKLRMAPWSASDRYDVGHWYQ